MVFCFATQTSMFRSAVAQGYISWEHMVIVYSNQEPFPSLKATRTS